MSTLPSTSPTWADSGNTNLAELALDENQITSVDTNLLSPLTSLRILNLRTNQIGSLPEDVFSSNTNLEQLILSNNKLSFLPEYVFKGLTNLSVLKIPGNGLEFLSRNLFDDLGALSDLGLAVNKLPQMYSDQFEGTPNLTSLTLAGNSIQSHRLPDDVFDNLSQLVSLDLFQNRISSLSPRLFNDKSSLQNLNVGRNHIVNLPAGLFAGSPNLVSIKFNSNRLKSPPTDLFDGLDALRFLNFCSNPAGLTLPALPSEIDPYEVLVDPCPNSSSTLSRATLEVDRNSIGEGGGPVPVKVTAKLLIPQSNRLKVNLVLSGEATTDDDYTFTPDHFFISSGRRLASATVTFTPNDDSFAETAESINIGASLTYRFTGEREDQFYLNKEGVTETTLTLTDNDSVATDIYLNVKPNWFREDLGTRSFTITATLAGQTLAVDTPITLGLSGTALRDTDYTVDQLPPLTIGSGASSATAILRVRPVNDNLKEGPETIQVTGSTTGALTVNPADITLRDEDLTSAGITLTPSPSSIAEDDGATDVTVTAALGSSWDQDRRTDPGRHGHWRRNRLHQHWHSRQHYH